MKRFWKYVFPGLFGLLIYITVRVLNDTLSHFRFWKRAWSTTAIELLFVVAAGYITMYAFGKLFQRFDKKLQHNIDFKIVLQELTWVVLIITAINNAIITPMVALTDDGLSWGDFANINIIPLLYCLVYYAVVRSNKLLHAYVNNRLLLEKITNDHLQTELKFLKAQYHPHFLFNALNTVYFQMDENIAEAKKSIEKFSELLRYQLYDQQQMVPISREFHYLQNFIELQQIRSSDKLKLQVHFDSSLNGEQVYPLLFLPLVENAFKYTGGDYRITIEANKENDQLRFAVANSVPAETSWIKQTSDQTRNGIGLENLKRRLDLLYPGKHTFTTTKKDDTFFAEIQLQLS
ncbi:MULTISPECIES: sensor histidine kinase [Niastella]|uniref:Histidine kinase n=1 Tax=Niastella soli TaxID=2821487 RepID=A0ABS3YWI3_9BACT|nr:histidine kinase [Niastella soli]MBO9202253.1 histidine kinase [Niastella soli]